MSGLYDEDGIDGPFDRAMKRAMKDDAKASVTKVGVGDFVQVSGGPAFVEGQPIKGRVEAVTGGVFGTVASVRVAATGKVWCLNVDHLKVLPKRAARNSALALLLFLAAAGLASAGEVEPREELSLSTGATFGIGAPAPTFQLGARLGAFEGAGSLAFVRASASQGAVPRQGWITRFDLDGYVAPRVLLGADYRNRNDGPFAKRQAFGHVGLALGPKTRVIYRHELFSTAEHPNRDRVLEVRRKWRFKYVTAETLISVVSSIDQAGHRGVGAHAHVSVGRRWTR